MEINQCVGFTKSFLGDGAAVLARSSGEERAPARHRAGVASMAWRTTRTRRKILISTQEGAEMNVLKSFPFDEVRVDFWFVETNKLDREAFMTFMSGKHYHCHHVDHVNTLCRHKDVRARRRRR